MERQDLNLAVTTYSLSGLGQIVYPTWGMWYLPERYELTIMQAEHPLSGMLGTSHVPDLANVFQTVPNLDI